MTKLPSFINNSISLLSLGKPIAALSILFDGMDRLMKLENFEEVNSIFLLMDPVETPLETVLGVLAWTRRATSKDLPARKAFLQAILARMESESKDPKGVV